MESNESSIIGFAKYAWSGYVYKTIIRIKNMQFHIVILNLEIDQQINYLFKIFKTE